MTVMIEWTPEMRDRLHALVHEEIRHGATDEDVITFDGHLLLISFAKYLIEYLDKRFA